MKGLGTSPEAKVQYFNVICPLGHRVRGQRTLGYQALRCPACGEGVFVLPASPLPDPAPPTQPRRSRTAVAERAVVEGPVELKDPAQATVDFGEEDDGLDQVDIVWDDEPAVADAGAAAASPSPGPRAEPAATAGHGGVPEAPSPPTKGRSKSVPAAGVPAAPGSPPAGKVAREPSRRDLYESAPRKAPARQNQAVRAAVVEAPSEPHGRQISVPRRASRRPLFILLTVGLLVMCTIALRSWRNRRQQLPQVALIGRTEGIPALEEGKFDKAYQLLSAAKEAVEALGGAVEDAETIRHAADEASIFVDLMPDTLEDLLEEAGRTSPQAWASRFETIYKGHAIIINSQISNTPDSNGPEPRRYELDYRVFPPGEAASFRGQKPRYARIDLTGFETVTQAGHHVGDQVIFGARLASFHYDSDAEEWVIGLEPKTGVSISHLKALETLGWPNTLLQDENRPDAESP